MAYSWCVGLTALLFTACSPLTHAPMHQLNATMYTDGALRPPDDPECIQRDRFLELMAKCTSTRQDWLVVACESVQSPELLTPTSVCLFAYGEWARTKGVNILPTLMVGNLMPNGALAGGWGALQVFDSDAIRKFIDTCPESVDSAFGNPAVLTELFNDPAMRLKLFRGDTCPPALEAIVEALVQVESQAFTAGRDDVRRSSQPSVPSPRTTEAGGAVGASASVARTLRTRLSKRSRATGASNGMRSDGSTRSHARSQASGLSSISNGGGTVVPTLFSTKVRCLVCLWRCGAVAVAV